MSLKFLTWLIKLNNGIGLYSKNSNELVSWVIWNNFGGLGMVQTMESHRRKGYAQIVIKALSKKIAETTGNASTAFAVVGNKRSEDMFAKMNYKRICLVNWAINYL